MMNLVNGNPKNKEIQKILEKNAKDKNNETTVLTQLKKVLEKNGNPLNEVYISTLDTGDLGRLRIRGKNGEITGFRFQHAQTEPLTIVRDGENNPQISVDSKGNIMVKVEGDAINTANQKVGKREGWVSIFYISKEMQKQTSSVTEATEQTNGEIPTKKIKEKTIEEVNAETFVYRMNGNLNRKAVDARNATGNLIDESQNAIANGADPDKHNFSGQITGIKAGLQNIKSKNLDSGLGQITGNLNLDMDKVLGSDKYKGFKVTGIRLTNARYLDPYAEFIENGFIVDIKTPKGDKMIRVGGDEMQKSGIDNEFVKQLQSGKDNAQLFQKLLMQNLPFIQKNSLM